MIGTPSLAGLALAAAGAVLVLVTGQGTRASAVVGFVAAASLVLGFGVPVVAPLATFVLGAGILTRAGRRIKERSHSAEGNRGRRSATQVVAKLGVPALLGIAGAFSPENQGWLAAAATASMAGAFADTAATEIGPLARGPVVRWNGLRLERASHGSVGGMSVAGLAGGAAAALALAGVALAVGLFRSPAEAAVSAFAGFAATGLESAIAPTPAGERLGHTGRNVLVSTLSAAIFAAIHWGGTR